jgi:hypothetical protein
LGDIVDVAHEDKKRFHEEAAANIAAPNGDSSDESEMDKE